MLWRAMLRSTAVGLLTNALKAQGANVQSSKDTPAPDDGGTTTWIVVYADDKKRGLNGTQYRSTGTVTIEIRVASDARVVQQPDGTNIDMGAADAALLLDAACEAVQNVLLGGQGFDASCACVQNSPTVTPDPDLFPLFFAGGLISDGASTDPGLNDSDFVAVQAVNANGTVTLSAPWALAGGDYLLHFGSFIGLFEPPIEQVETFTHEPNEDSKRHIAGATIEIVGNAVETFEPVITTPFNGVNLYVDAISPFDPQGNYRNLEPFTVEAPPRTAGPDGRPEIVGSVDNLQNPPPAPPCDTGD